MAKAEVITPEGIRVKLEGTPSEISKVLRELEKKTTQNEQLHSPKQKKMGRTLLVDLIASLADGGFFKKPRDLASIKNALEEMGHHYPVTTLSPVMLRQVRRKNLRRIRDKGRWVYVN